MATFEHAHRKIIESTFSFPEFVPACKKSVYSICSFLRYSQFQGPMTRQAHSFLTMPTQKIFDQLLILVNLCQFQSPVTRLATPISDHAHPKHFQAPSNLHEFVPACKKSVSSICLFFRYSQIQSPKTRLATPIFDYAQTKNFQSTFNFCEFPSTCKK